ncbi:MAG: DMT family transporter [Actinomycetota bacterium]|nr:DMT family transporter [Actinomycetota bacterium]
MLRALAILLAICGAAFLSLGAQFQNDAVTKHHAPDQPKIGSLHIRQIIDLLKRPRWLTGTTFLVLAVLFQLGALALAPLIVVQPIGAIALIITSVLNARIYGIKLDVKTISAIALTMLGVGAFVTFAASSAINVEMSNEKLLQVVGILFLLLLLFGFGFAFTRGQVGALTYISGAGVLYGFVASLAKVVIQRLYQADFDLLTLLAAVSLVGATFLGGWFVQNAYASGPPDLVIAGLTVIDPAIAVGIAIIILGEASQAQFADIIGFIIAGFVALAGVLLLSKVHPQLSGDR